MLVAVPQRFKVARRCTIKNKEYASDRVGAHQTAQLIKKLKFIPTDNLSVVKIILAAYDENEYFVVLRDRIVSLDYVRSYNLEYLKLT